MSDSSPAPRNSHGAEGNPRLSRQGPASLRHHVELQRLASAARVGFRRRFWRAVYCPRRGQCAIIGGRWQPAIRRPAFAHSAFPRARPYKLRRCRRAIDTRLRGTRQLSRIQILVDSIPRRPRRSRLAVAPGGDAHASRRGQRPLEHAADSRNTEGGSARPKGVWNSSVRSTKSKQAGSVSGVSPARSAVLAHYR
jgi:hypothetical protein